MDFWGSSARVARCFLAFFDIRRTALPFGINVPSSSATNFLHRDPYICLSSFFLVTSLLLQFLPPLSPSRLAFKVNHVLVEGRTRVISQSLLGTKFDIFNFLLLFFFTVNVIFRKWLINRQWTKMKISGVWSLKILLQMRMIEWYSFTRIFRAKKLLHTYTHIHTQISFIYTT